MSEKEKGKEESTGSEGKMHLTSLVVKRRDEVPEDAVLIVEYRREDSDSLYHHASYMCYSPGQMNSVRKAIEDHRHDVREIEIRTRHWTQKFSDFEPFDSECAYADGDPSSFGDYLELVRRNAKYMCFYGEDLVAEFRSAESPEELADMIMAASEFCSSDNGRE